MSKDSMRVTIEGKTLVVASTRGNKETDVKVNGQPVILGINAYIYAEPK